MLLEDDIGPLTDEQVSDESSPPPLTPPTDDTTGEFGRGGPQVSHSTEHPTIKLPNLAEYILVVHVVQCKYCQGVSQLKLYNIVRRRIHAATLFLTLAIVDSSSFPYSILLKQ